MTRHEILRPKGQTAVSFGKFAVRLSPVEQTNLLRFQTLGYH
jgi:hypothetical protein